MTLTTLASSSSGNCMVVSQGETHLLVDAGISAKRITAGLATLGLTPHDLSGILITHTHTDHICGLATLTKHFDVPLYASEPVARQLCYRLPVEGRMQSFAPGDCFPLPQLHIRSIPTSHDTDGSVGYRLENQQGRCMVVVTDLGTVTEDVRAGVLGAHLAVIECNHHIPLLKAGPYPPAIKARILGDRGHLSNQAGAALCVQAVCAGATQLVLAHLSQENNSPTLALAAVEEALTQQGAHAHFSVAPHRTVGTTYEV